MSILSVGIVFMNLFACANDPKVAVEEITDASDVPTPSENLDTEESEESNPEDALENNDPVTVDYGIDDENSLLYVQVWKDEEAVVDK